MVKAEPQLCGISYRLLALAALIIQTTSAVIVTRYTRILSEGPQYYSTTLVLMSELFKLVMSCLLVYRESSTDVQTTSNWEAFKITMYEENFARPGDTLKLVIPAGLYTLQNNLIYVALSNLEATTFQVGYQMKVITTAVLSVMMLNRKLSFIKWVAIIILTIGIILTQLQSTGSGKVDSAKTEQNFMVGIISVITCGFCSAFAGVYFEKILKGTNPSVWVRNAQLAFFASLLALGGCIMTDGFFVLLPGTFFTGYQFSTWLLITIQGVGGLIVAMVVKYADNIMKGFATAISIILCGVTSAYYFAFQPNYLFLVGSTLVLIATFVYSAPDPPSVTITSIPPGDGPSSKV